MSRFPLVVVAVDGSPDIESTVEFAAAIARRYAARLDAVHVVPRGRSPWAAPDDDANLRLRLGALRPSIERHGVRFRTVTLRGAPERALLAHAQLNAARMIVLGRNYGASHPWRTSTVARRVSRASPVPVLVLPTERAAFRPGEKLPWKNIVAAVDFTVASAIALRTAADITREWGARLTMFHAMRWPRHMVFSGGEASRLVRDLPIEMRQVAERLKTKARAFGADDAVPVVMSGMADRGILETATNQAADLIVMGVAPRTSVDEVVFGSTLRAVLRRAQTPVLVVPVVGGAHDWSDDMNEYEASHVSSTGAGVTRIAA